MLRRDRSVLVFFFEDGSRGALLRAPAFKSAVLPGDEPSTTAICLFLPTDAPDDLAGVTMAAGTPVACSVAWLA